MEGHSDSDSEHFVDASDEFCESIRDKTIAHNVDACPDSSTGYINEDNSDFEKINEELSVLLTQDNSSDDTDDNLPMEKSADILRTENDSFKQQESVNSESGDLQGGDGDSILNCDKMSKCNQSGTESLKTSFTSKSETLKPSQNEDFSCANDESSLPDESESNKQDSDEENLEVIVEEEIQREKEALMTEEEKEVLREESQSLKAEGNDLFKTGEYIAAKEKYTQAILTCPLCFGKERSIMYSNRAACQLKLEYYEKCTKDCDKALEINPNYLKALMRRAEAQEKSEKLDEALKDYQQALEMDASLWKAREACMRLPEEIKERNEKLKDEMLGKLKDLGNMILKPFGLSTNNFQMNQDPNTGSYSVNFQQGATNSK